ncbi:MAG: hypothetical protein JJU20_08855 [Opitutales bacterium]|nr:hypothetical protein [Opitutales bacterium]
MYLVVAILCFLGVLIHIPGILTQYRIDPTSAWLWIDIGFAVVGVFLAYYFWHRHHQKKLEKPD